MEYPELIAPIPGEEKVIEIDITKLYAFKNHPFRVVEDKQMEDLKDSISKFGIMNPLIVRPMEAGCYEIISGHRRRFAANQLGIKKLPAIVRPMDEEESIIAMIDSNLYREFISHSEKAYAYYMKNEAIKRKGGKKIGCNGRSRDKPIPKSIEMIGQITGDSPRQVARYIRLINLIPELLRKLDLCELSFNPAVEISYLTPEEQMDLLEAMEYTQNTPSLSKAQRLKRLSQEGKLTAKITQDIMAEVIAEGAENISFRASKLKPYFPDDYTPEMIRAEILNLLQTRKLKGEQHV